MFRLKVKPANVKRLYDFDGAEPLVCVEPVAKIKENCELETTYMLIYIYIYSLFKCT